MTSGRISVARTLSKILRAIKNFIGRRRPGDISIDEIFACAPLRHDLGRKRITPPGVTTTLISGYFF